MHPSVQDVPASLAPSLMLACTLSREDVRDAFISLKAGSLAELPPGAVVGTSSTRRQAQLLARHPHLKVGLAFAWGTVHAWSNQVIDSYRPHC